MGVLFSLAIFSLLSVEQPIARQTVHATLIPMKEVGYQEFKCPLCAGMELHLAFRKSGYSFYACQNCGHVAVFPLPNAGETQAHYEASYSEDYLAQNIAWFKVLAAKRMGIINRYFYPEFKGDLLDVGSGYGFFLKAAKTEGWMTQGIEASPAELEYSVERLGLSVCCGDVVPAMESLPGEAFDVISFWHVLEHLEEPGRILLQAKRTLKPGGILVLNSPNLDSTVFRLLGPGWSWVYVPGHLQYFRVTPFANWLRAQALSVCTVETWTYVPNLYFMLEEALLLKIAALLEWGTIPRKIAGRITRFVFSAYHQQVIQSRLRFLYRLTPYLDRYLVCHLLGHEFLIVARK